MHGKLQLFKTYQTVDPSFPFRFCRQGATDLQLQHGINQRFIQSAVYIVCVNRNNWCDQFMGVFFGLFSIQRPHTPNNIV